MSRIPLVALHAFEYAGEYVRPGQVFDAVSAFDAQLLVTIRRARLLTADTVPAVDVLPMPPATPEAPPKKRRPYKRRQPKPPAVN